MRALPRVRRIPGYAAFFAGIYLIYHAKPLEALDIKYWAKPRAERELEVETRMLNKLQASPELQARLKAVAKQLKLVDAEVRRAAAVSRAEGSAARGAHRCTGALALPRRPGSNGVGAGRLARLRRCTTWY